MSIRNIGMNEQIALTTFVDLFIIDYHVFFHSLHSLITHDNHLFHMNLLVIKKYNSNTKTLT